jgi:hypothetical protein
LDIIFAVNLYMIGCGMVIIALCGFSCCNSHPSGGGTYAQLP